MPARIDLQPLAAASPAARATADRLLAERAARLPQPRLPRSLDRAPQPANPWLLTVSHDQQALAAMVIGHREVSEATQQAFEGTSPVTVSALATTLCAADRDVADLSGRLRESLLAIWPTADRMTVFLALADRHGGQFLHNLGMSLDGYLSIATHPNTTTAGPPATTVRPAAPADAPAVADLEIEHVRAQTSTSPFVNEPAWDAPLLASQTAAAIRRGARFLIADQSGHPVGVIRYSHHDVPDDGVTRRLPPGRVGMVEWVSVRAAYRASGIGSLLIASAINAMATEAVDYWAVFHGATNPYSTPRFWRRFGFQPAHGTWERWLR